MYKLVKSMDVNDIIKALPLYESTDSMKIIVDESDLIIFRLVGVKFNYSEVVFED